MATAAAAASAAPLAEFALRPPPSAHTPVVEVAVCWQGPPSPTPTPVVEEAVYWQFLPPHPHTCSRGGSVPAGHLAPPAQIPGSSSPRSCWQAGGGRAAGGGGGRGVGRQARGGAGEGGSSK